MIIANTQADVDLNPATDKLKIKQIALPYFGTLSADELKKQISFRALLEADGHKLKRGGSGYSCCCPFHNDRTPSFVVNENDNYGNCYGCNWHGSIIDYIMASKECDFKAAMEYLQDETTLQGTLTAKPVAKKEIEEAQYEFSEAEKKSIAKYLSRIPVEPQLCETIARVRNWKPATIRQLCASGHLGWAGDALAFITSEGVKIREWPGRRFSMECGDQGLWREDLIPAASTVFITEGETDAITLIEDGIEKDGTAVVVAAPAAGIFKTRWISLFTGKEVTICFDADEPGQKGARAVLDLLAPVAKALFNFIPKEVR